MVANHSGGSRRLDSYPDEAAALDAARLLAQRLTLGSSTAARLTEAESISFVGARDILKPFGVDVLPAATAVADALKLVGSLGHVRSACEAWARRRPTGQDRTVAQVVDALLAEKAARGVSARYQSDLRSRLGRVARDFNCQAGSVTGPAVQAWLDGLGLAPKSRLNYRRAILTLFTFAERRGFIDRGSNPARETEQVRAKVARIHVFSPEQLRRLLDASTVDTLPVLVLCAFAGLRTAEALRLSWEDIAFDAGRVVVGADRAKTATRRIAPLPDCALAWLAPYRGKVGPVWPHSPHSFIPARVKEARRAGVRWLPNALRHSWISARVSVTQNVPQVALEAGNSPAVVFSNYRELRTPEQASAWFAVRPASAPENVLQLSAAVGQ